MAHLQVVVLKWNLDLETDEARGIARRVRDELIPLLRSRPGFISYQGFVAGDQPRTSVAVVAWASAEQAAAGTREAAVWTQEHAGRYLAGREVYAGDAILAS